MAKWASNAFLDGGLNYLKNNVAFVTLLKAYSAGDSFAAAVTTNGIASAAMTSSDVTIASNGSNRTATTATKTATASANSGASPNLHLCYHDGSNIIWVTDETSDQVVTSGNPVNFPSTVYTAQQPV